MKTRFPSILNMGLSSIITIFLVLALAVFASLSLLTARSDYDLSRETADRLTQVTQANNLGEEFRKKIDVSCVKSYNELQDKDVSQYYTLVEQDLTSEQDVTCHWNSQILEISTDIPVNDSQVLHIVAIPTLPTHSGDSYYQITEWKVQKTSDWKMDDSLDLYTPSE